MNYLTKVSAPKKIEVVDVSKNNIYERIVAGTVQGLQNRVEPTVYLFHQEEGQPGYTSPFWADYYCKRYDLKKQTISLDALVKRMITKGLIKGIVVYDASYPALAHIAMVQSSLGNLIPVHESLLKHYKGLGLKVVEDLRKRWDDEVDARLWAAHELLPKTSKKIVGHLRLSVKNGELDSCDIPMLDLYVKENAFMFCACAEKGQVFPGKGWDQKILHFVYSHLDPFAIFAGWLFWHDNGDERTFAESSYIANISSNDKMGLCAGGISPNFSFHSSIKDNPRQKKKIDKSTKTDDKGAYVALSVSDGDALWCPHNGFCGQWDSPERGRFPVAWSFNPLVVEFCPGIFRYYLETATENDLLVASCGGVGYVYPSLIHDIETYSKINREYMKKSGFDIIAGMNDRCLRTEKWNDFGEIITNKISPLMQYPEVQGVVEGYGPRYNPGKGWKEQLIVSNGKGWLLNIYEDDFTWFERVSAEKILKAIVRITKEEKMRPLFLPFFLGIPHGITLDKLSEVVKGLPKDVKLLRMDKFFSMFNNKYGKMSTLSKKKRKK